jgi:hypothetical protein
MKTLQEVKKEIQLSDNDIKSVWERNVNVRSRDGKMMLFDDFRLSLGGADAKWGTKVFYKTCTDLGVLKKCENSTGYCPTTKVIEKYPNLFHFDKETQQWGISTSELDNWNDSILPHIVKHAMDVREQFAQVKKIKNRARYYENKNVTKELF